MMGVLNHEYIATELLVLAELFDKKLSDGKLLSYLEVLQDLTIEQFTQGIGEAKRKCRYFPVPAEILELAGIKSLKTIIDQEAEESWIRIRLWKKPLKQLTITNIEYLVIEEMGGRGEVSTAFGLWPIQQEYFRKNDFITRYRKHRKTLQPQIHQEIAPVTLIEQHLQSDWQEHDEELQGLSDWEKGKKVANELLRKIKNGERITPIKDITFSEWKKTIDERPDFKKKASGDDEGFQKI